MRALRSFMRSSGPYRNLTSFAPLSRKEPSVSYMFLHGKLSFPDPFHVQIVRFSKRKITVEVDFYFVDRTGFEPVTSSLQMTRSTN